ncbi:MAG: hypothetical protein U0324_37085 [Polyangiales bacterium]
MVDHRPHAGVALDLLIRLGLAQRKAPACDDKPAEPKDGAPKPA